MLMQEHGNAIFVYILYIFLYRIPRVTTFQEFRNIRLGSTKAEETFLQVVVYCRFSILALKRPPEGIIFNSIDRTYI